MKRLTPEQLWDRKVSFWFMMGLLSMFVVMLGLTGNAGAGTAAKVLGGFGGALFCCLMANRAVERGPHD